MSKPKSPVQPQDEQEAFFVRSKPEPIPFSKFLYNSNEGTVLGRTAASWDLTSDSSGLILPHSCRFSRVSNHHIKQIYHCDMRGQSVLQDALTKMLTSIALCMLVTISIFVKWSANLSTARWQN